MRRLLLPLLIAAPLTVHAQFWGTSSAEGDYVVAIDQIVSVSQHSYVVDGAAKVTEVNIATSSPLLVRYYHIDVITPQTPAAVGQSVINKVTEMAKEAAGRVSPNDLKVVKNYPTTTHAKTAEYRLGSSEDLRRVFNSARLALTQRKPEIVKID